MKEKEHCLLNPKFIKLGKRTLIANFVKKGKDDEKINVKIVKNCSFGYYLIKTYKQYEKNKILLDEGDEYIVDCKLLKKINIKIWNAIVNNNYN